VAGDGGGALTWLFVPGTSSASAPEPADWALASNSRSTEQFASLTWRGKPRRPLLWLRAWHRDSSLRLLSGLTLEPSTLDLGVASWIASLAATRASPTALPERASEQPTTVSSSTKSSASCASAGRIVSSARTSQGMQTDSLQSLSRHWKQWATGLRREYSARAKSAPATDASDCSSWPTATAVNRVRSPETLAKCEDFRLRNAGQKTVPLCLEEVATTWPTARVSRGGYARDNGDPAKERPTLEGAAAFWATPKTVTGGANSKRAERGAGGPDLQEQAGQWATPRASDGGRSATHAEFSGRTATHNGVKVQIGLEHQAKSWPTATTRMYRGGGQAVTRSDGKSRLDMLDWAAEGWSPSTAPDPAIPAGPTSSPPAPTSRPQLNARFAEYLMGLPPEWTSCGPSATEFTRWQSDMRGALSTLCSRKAPETLL
jgi:hypothetical protein